MRYLLALLLLFPCPVSATTCEITYRLAVTQGIGPYPPGTEITGAALFTTRSSFRQEGGATAHLADGIMTLDGQISGRLWTLVTTNRTHSSDLIGIYAVEVTGLTFVGQEFRGPMSITLFADPGTWPHERPPLTQAEWDSFDLRRVFQLHAPEAGDMLAGDVVSLDAQCVDSAPSEQ